MKLSEAGNIPLDSAVLKSLFPNHKSVNNKISELEKAETLIRLKKGLYVVSPEESGVLLSMELIANHLYGPSYVSMQSALRYYGLIPERVHTMHSMTTKHSRAFTNSLGTFDYQQCTKAYFPIGIRQETSNNATFLLAAPEKALCDLLLFTPNLNLRFQKDIRIYLEEDLRFDTSALQSLNKELLAQCMEAGKKKSTLQNLLKIL